MTAGTAEDPKKTTTYRVLVVVVSILSVLILLAFAALIAGGIRQFSGHHASGGCVGDCGTAQLPPGAKITSIQTTGNRLIIGFHDANGDGIEIVDPDTVKLIAIIRPASHGLPK